MPIKESLERKKITFFVGKGGVGKTTLAAASAVSLAELVENQMRILVASTDPAHSLTDIFGLRYSTGKTIRVYKDLNMDIVQITPKSAGEYTGIHSILKLFKFMNDRGMPIDLDSISCMISLAYYSTNLENHGYGKLIIDSEPTAGLFRLLALPETIDTNIERFVKHPYLSYAFELLNSSLGQFTRHDFMEDSQSIAELLKEFRAILSDHNQTGFIVVTSPERAVISETKRIMEELQRYGFSIEGVIFNKFIGEDYDIKTIRANQSRLMREFQRSSSRVPTTLVQYQGNNLERQQLYTIGNRLLENQ